MTIAIALRLRCESPLRSGGGGPEPPGGEPLARTEDGRAVLRGAALAEALRVYAMRLAPALGMRTCARVLGVDAVDDCLVCAMFEPGRGADAGAAPRLRIADAPLLVPPLVRTRTGITIARATGGPADAPHLATFDELPAGTRFRATLTLDTAGAPELDARAMRLLLLALLEDLRRPHALALGHDRARGMGQVRLVGASVDSGIDGDRLTRSRAETAYTIAPDVSGDGIPAPASRSPGISPAGNARGNREGHALTTEPTRPGQHAPPSRQDSGHTWEGRDAAGARSVAAVAPRRASDMAVSEGEEGVAATLIELLGDPAALYTRMESVTSVREGALAAWIRFDFTLACTGGYLDVDACDDAGDGIRAVLDGGALRGVLRARAEYIARSWWEWASPGAPDPAACPACHPDAAGDAPLAACADPAGDARGVCLACRLFGGNGIRSRLIVAGGAATRLHTWTRLGRLPLDRFTGAASTDGARPRRIAWRPSFAVALYLPSPRDWEIGWLSLCLFDVMSGRVTVGGGGAEGLGWCVADSVRVTGGWTGPAAPAWLDGAAEDIGREGVFRARSVEWSRRGALPPGLASAIAAWYRTLASFGRDGAGLARDAVTPEQRALYLAKQAAEDAGP